MRPLAGTVLEVMGDPVRGRGRQTWPAPTSLPERLGTTWGDNPVFEGLAAGRSALSEISEQLARADVAALETQGRFIQSRYGQDGPQAVAISAPEPEASEGSEKT